MSEIQPLEKELEEDLFTKKKLTVYHSLFALLIVCLLFTVMLGPLVVSLVAYMTAHNARLRTVEIGAVLLEHDKSEQRQMEEIRLRVRELERRMYRREERAAGSGSRGIEH